MKKETYVADLRMLLSTCNFGQIRDSLIRDRIVCSINDSGLRERLLREDNLTLDKCLQVCRAKELSRENSRTLAGAHTVVEVHMIKFLCNFCGRTHERDKNKCPAFGKRCKKCGKENHFAVKCKTKHNQDKGKRVHHVMERDAEEYEDIMSVTTAEILTVTGKEASDDKSTNSQLFAGMLIGKELVKFQIHCGASCNVIPVNLLSPETQLDNTKTVLVMYNKTRLHPLGKCKIKVRNPRNQKLYRLEFGE